ncbi:MAG TPA: bifunctional folylpolyglutamate synthase/dihydrofolate synthase [Sulfurihydrogenibium sp.]|uniref:glutamate ligase domain-containing protein n=1 Tax=Sulfurihydrogenibium sp. (strain YO3AOP1) TaxID=436114 RepID=UPI0001724200|nr:folylpolyglutamate synthase/dihydrofolate synthase family protein [Sulfurihydrogenibium sp. YO3AOP1]ACD67112.1 FolC bifunctional protein [Sulfurihydrogenibium sp. YO3AOP1]HBT98849.1 bifunctional folylpolyglutamate synthase/dihydrofolate synthase [Sulfurihydrogenibium sp.]
MQNLYDLFQKKAFNIEPGLERIRSALKELNNPEKNFKSILVAGTNGKGSTSAYLESLLRHYGYKTGLFTSPHLIRENERWQIDRKEIDDKKLQNYINELKPIIEKYNLTYFEACTLLAFKYFSDKKVDIAVVEVGLGGRWDSTNVLEPETSVITNVSFDHMHMLGNTLLDIAYEKTGITRQDKPAVIGRNQPEIIHWLKERKIKEYYIKDIDYFVKEIDFNKYNYKFKEHIFENLEISMLGKRQIENSSLALTTFLLFLDKNNQPVVENIIRKALYNTKWKGRMEIISKNPFIIIDGAHNEEGLIKTFQEIKEIFPNKKIFTIFSFMKDKDTEKMINIIKQNSDFYIATVMPFSRAMTAEDFKNLGIENVKENHLEAVKELKNSVDKDTIILITGSLYLIGEILKDGWNTFSK